MVFTQIIEKFNPNHDNLGRFSSGGGAQRFALPKKGGAKGKSNSVKALSDNALINEYEDLAGKEEIARDGMVAGIYNNPDDYPSSTTATQRLKTPDRIRRSPEAHKKNLTRIVARRKTIELEAKRRKLDLVARNPAWFQTTMVKAEELTKYNMNHDALGRFASGSGMGAKAKGVSPIKKLASKLESSADWSSVRAVESRERKKIAKAFDDAPQQLTREQLASWDYVEQEVVKQFDMLTKELGVVVEFVGYDPYSSHQDMYDSFQTTGILKIMSTAVTGSHTYWSDSTNDKFRAVHDAFGHLATGVGFDRHGEQAAYQAHKSMFEPKGYLALASELKGQNAYMVERGDFPDQRLVALPENLQKSLDSIKNDKSDYESQSDKDNLFELGGTHHASNGRNLYRKKYTFQAVVGKFANVSAVTKEEATASDVHVVTTMGAKRKKRKRTQKMALEDVKAKTAELKKYNTNHDELGRFSSGSGGGKTRSAMVRGKWGRASTLASRAVRAVAGGYKSSGGDKKTTGFTLPAGERVPRPRLAMPKERRLAVPAQLKTRIVATNKRDLAKAKKVEAYMMKPAKNFKKISERKYVQARIRQMTRGVARPSGMSKPYRIKKDRVMTLEIVLSKIFAAGRLKHGI